MVTVKKFVHTARRCLKTPYHHQGRSPGLGLDCIGLVAWTCWTLELLPKSYDYTDYPPRPDGVTLCREFNKVFEPTEEIRPGTILVFAIPVPRHCAICTGDSIIHTWSKYLSKAPSELAGRVVEHAYNSRWKKFFHSAYWVPGVEN